MPELRRKLATEEGIRREFIEHLAGNVETDGSQEPSGWRGHK